MLSSGIFIDLKESSNIGNGSTIGDVCQRFEGNAGTYDPVLDTRPHTLTPVGTCDYVKQHYPKLNDCEDCPACVEVKEVSSGKDK